MDEFESCNATVQADGETLDTCSTTNTYLPTHGSITKSNYICRCRNLVLLHLEALFGYLAGLFYFFLVWTRGNCLRYISNSPGQDQKIRTVKSHRVEMSTVSVKHIPKAVWFNKEWWYPSNNLFEKSSWADSSSSHGKLQFMVKSPPGRTQSLANKEKWRPTVNGKYRI